MSFEMRSHLAALAGLTLLIAGCGGGSAGTTAAPGGGAGAQAATGTDEPDEPGSEAKKKVDPGTVATLRVSVKFAGPEVKNKRIKMGADQFCEGAHDSAVREERFLRNDNQTMANVFVWLSKGLRDYEFPAPTEKVLLDQKGCQYTPHVLGIQVKQLLEIRNSDDTLHNVHPMPKKNKEKNIAMPFKGKTIEESFRRQELSISVKCNVHPWMHSIIHVVKHPLFAITPEGEGVAVISGVPPGKYTLEAVHEELGTLEAEFEVGPKETKELVLEFKPQS